VIPSIEEAKRAGHLIVFVPRNLSLKQGIHFILGVVELCRAGSGPKCHFFVAGSFLQHLPGSHGYQKALRGALASMSSEGKTLLTFLGGVSHDCMSYCYAASDIVVFPSFASEGVPLSVLEAMAFGRAVVATNIGGLNDVIDDGLNGLLVKPSVESLANGIQRLAADPRLRRQFGEEARDKAEKRFSLSRWKDSASEFMRRNGWFS
jgi:glycosyltransferase involved in cell wall biosynthesis